MEILEHKNVRREASNCLPFNDIRGCEAVWEGGGEPGVDVILPTVRSLQTQTYRQTTDRCRTFLCLAQVRQSYFIPWSVSEAPCLGFLLTLLLFNF